MKEIVIHSFEELNDLIFKNCYDEKIGRYRNDFVYRGQYADYPLYSSLNRVCHHNLKLERSIIRNFKKYGYADLNLKDSFWQLLAKGQHFGLPTRLLDWTYSPLVAAHFATVDIDHYDKDGVIYAIDLKDSISTLPKCLKDEITKTNSHTFSIAMLDRHVETLGDLERLSKKPFFLFYEPGSDDNRMINQYSLFSICSDPKYTIADLLKGKKNSMYKIIIPKEIKLEIRDKLDYINITERVIFPGLDSVCSWISRRYADLGEYKKKGKK